MNFNSLVAAFNRLPVWQRRLRVWGFTVQSSTFDRWLYLWMHRLDRMGREELAFFQQVISPGMQVADVGANLGLYSLLLARCTGPTGRVYCFEPDTQMATMLRQNLAANHASHAEVFQCAVGAATGYAVLQRNVVNSGDNRLGLNTGTALHCEQASVPVCALQDALQGRRLDFIKMDVQGWEGEALRGLAGLLDANPNLQIYFEFWPHGLRLAGTDIAKLTDILLQLRLHPMLVGSSGRTTPVDLVELEKEMKPKAFTNLLAMR